MCLGVTLQAVEIAREQVTRAAHIAAGSCRHSPPARLNLDRHVDKQPGRPTDQLRANTSRGQLREVRQVSELAEDGTHRLVNVRTGPRANAGCGSWRPAPPPKIA